MLEGPTDYFLSSKARYQDSQDEEDAAELFFAIQNMVNHGLEVKWDDTLIKMETLLKREGVNTSLAELLQTRIADLTETEIKQRIPKITRKLIGESGTGDDVTNINRFIVRMLPRRTEGTYDPDTKIHTPGEEYNVSQLRERGGLGVDRGTKGASIADRPIVSERNHDVDDYMPFRDLMDIDPQMFEMAAEIGIERWAQMVLDPNNHEFELDKWLPVLRTLNSRPDMSNIHTESTTYDADGEPIKAGNTDPYTGLGVFSDSPGTEDAMRNLIDSLLSYGGDGSLERMEENIANWNRGIAAKYEHLGSDSTMFRYHLRDENGNFILDEKGDRVESRPQSLPHPQIKKTHLYWGGPRILREDSETGKEEILPINIKMNSKGMIEGFLPPENTWTRINENNYNQWLDKHTQPDDETGIHYLLNNMEEQEKRELYRDWWHLKVDGIDDSTIKSWLIENGRRVYGPDGTFHSLLDTIRDSKEFTDIRDRGMYGSPSRVGIIPLTLGLGLGTTPEERASAIAHMLYYYQEHHSIDRHFQKQAEESDYDMVERQRAPYWPGRLGNLNSGDLLHHILHYEMMIGAAIHGNFTGDMYNGDSALPPYFHGNTEHSERAIKNALRHAHGYFRQIADESEKRVGFGKYTAQQKTGMKSFDDMLRLSDVKYHPTKNIPESLVGIESLDELEERLVELCSFLPDEFKKGDDALHRILYYFHEDPEGSRQSDAALALSGVAPFIFPLMPLIEGEGILDPTNDNYVHPSEPIHEVKKSPAWAFHTAFRLGGRQMSHPDAFECSVKLKPWKVKPIMNREVHLADTTLNSPPTPHKLFNDDGTKSEFSFWLDGLPEQLHDEIRKLLDSSSEYQPPSTSYFGAVKSHFYPPEIDKSCTNSELVQLGIRLYQGVAMSLVGEDDPQFGTKTEELADAILPPIGDLPGTYSAFRRWNTEDWPFGVRPANSTIGHHIALFAPGKIGSFILPVDQMGFPRNLGTHEKTEGGVTRIVETENPEFKEYDRMFPRRERDMRDNPVIKHHDMLTLDRLFGKGIFLPWGVRTQDPAETLKAIRMQSLYTPQTKERYRGIGDASHESRTPQRAGFLRYQIDNTTGGRERLNVAHEAERELILDFLLHGVGGEGLTYTDDSGNERLILEDPHGFLEKHGGKRIPEYLESKENTLFGIGTSLRGLFGISKATEGVDHSKLDELPVQSGVAHLYEVEPEDDGQFYLPTEERRIGGPKLPNFDKHLVIEKGHDWWKPIMGTAVTLNPFHSSEPGFREDLTNVIIDSRTGEEKIRIPKKTMTGEDNIIKLGDKFYFVGLHPSKNKFSAANYLREREREAGGTHLYDDYHGLEREAYEGAPKTRENEVNNSVNMNRIGQFQMGVLKHSQALHAAKSIMPLLIRHFARENASSWWDSPDMEQMTVEDKAVMAENNFMNAYLMKDDTRPDLDSMKAAVLRHLVTVAKRYVNPTHHWARVNLLENLEKDGFYFTDAEKEAIQTPHLNSHVRFQRPQYQIVDPAKINHPFYRASREGVNQRDIEGIDLLKEIARDYYEGEDFSGEWSGEKALEILEEGFNHHFPPMQKGREREGVGEESGKGWSLSGEPPRHQWWYHEPISDKDRGLLIPKGDWPGWEEIIRQAKHHKKGKADNPLWHFKPREDEPLIQGQKRDPKKTHTNSEIIRRGRRANGSLILARRLIDLLHSPDVDDIEMSTFLRGTFIPALRPVMEKFRDEMEQQKGWLPEHEPHEKLDYDDPDTLLKEYARVIFLKGIQRPIANPAPLYTQKESLPSDIGDFAEYTGSMSLHRAHLLIGASHWHDRYGSYATHLPFDVRISRDIDTPPKLVRYDGEAIPPLDVGIFGTMGDAVAGVPPNPSRIRAPIAHRMGEGSQSNWPGIDPSVTQGSVIAGGGSLSTARRSVFNLAPNVLRYLYGFPLPPITTPKVGVAQAASEGDPNMLASLDVLTDIDLLLKDDDRDPGKPIPIKAMHRIFKLSDLQYLKGFSDDWVVSSWPAGTRVIVTKKAKRVTLRDSSGKAVSVPNSVREGIKKAHEGDYILDAIWDSSILHVVDIVDVGGDDIALKPTKDRSRHLRANFESTEEVLFPAPINTKRVDGQGLDRSVSDLLKEKGVKQVLLRDAESTYMRGETRHPKWVLLTPEKQIDVLVISSNGASCLLGVGPIHDDDARAIGNRSVRYDGDYYMDVGSLHHSGLEDGDYVTVGVSGVSQSVRKKFSVFRLNGVRYIKEAENKSTDSMDTLNILSGDDEMNVPHNVRIKKGSIHIDVPTGHIVYDTEQYGNSFLLKDVDSPDDYTLRVVESQAEYWSPLAAVLLRSEKEAVVPEPPANHDKKPKKVLPKKDRLLKDPEVVKTVVVALEAVEGMLKEKITWTGPKGLGIDYATPVESPRGPTKVTEPYDLPDHDPAARQKEPKACWCGAEKGEECKQGVGHKMEHCPNAHPPKKERKAEHLKVSHNSHKDSSV